MARRRSRIKPVEILTTNAKCCIPDLASYNKQLLTAIVSLIPIVASGMVGQDPSAQMGPLGPGTYALDRPPGPGNFYLPV
jgi:hypothetical protein